MGENTRKYAFQNRGEDPGTAKQRASIGMYVTRSYVLLHQMHGERWPTTPFESPKWDATMGPPGHPNLAFHNTMVPVGGGYGPTLVN